MKDATDFLPLTQITLHILLALAAENLHGYGIIKKIEDYTTNDGTISLGTMYGALKRLGRLGLIERDDIAGNEPDPRIVKYRLTELGEQVARAEITRLQTELELVNQLAPQLFEPI